MDASTLGTILGVAAAAFVSYLISNRGKKETKKETKAEVETEVKTQVEQAQKSFEETYAADAYARDQKQREADAIRIADRERRIAQLEARVDQSDEQREADAAKIAAL